MCLVFSASSDAEGGGSITCPAAAESFPAPPDAGATRSAPPGVACVSVVVDGTPVTTAPAADDAPVAVSHQEPVICSIAGRQDCWRRTLAANSSSYRCWQCCSSGMGTCHRPGSLVPLAGMQRLRVSVFYVRSQGPQKLRGKVENMACATGCIPGSGQPELANDSTVL